MKIYVNAGAVTHVMPVLRKKEAVRCNARSTRGRCKKVRNFRKKRKKRILRSALLSTHNETPTHCDNDHIYAAISASITTLAVPSRDYGNSNILCAIILAVSYYFPANVFENAILLHSYSWNTKFVFA